MQDPVSEFEVDDLLVSIRKLISKRESSVAQKETEGRLLLTPDLRIFAGREHEPAVEAAQAGPERDEAFGDDGLLQAQTAGELPSFLEKSLQRHAEAETAHSDDVYVLTHSSQESVDAEEIPPVKPEDEKQAGNKDPLSGLQAPLSTGSEPAQKDGIAEELAGPDGMSFEEQIDIELNAVEGGGAAFADKSKADAAGQGAGADDPKPRLAVYISEQMNAKLAALETVIDKTQESWEADDVDFGENSGGKTPELEWEDVDAVYESAPVVEEFSVEEEERFEEGHAEEEDIDEDDVIDEDSLREIVSSIVREELQGVLGERITRNVRKLVRREIQQAMTTKDLD